MIDWQTWIVFIVVAAWGLSLAFRKRRQDRNGCWNCRWCDCDEAQEYEFRCVNPLVRRNKVNPATDGEYCYCWKEEK